MNNKLLKSSIIITLFLGILGGGYYLFLKSLPVEPTRERIAFRVTTNSIFSSSKIYVMNTSEPEIIEVVHKGGFQRKLIWLPSLDKISFYDHDEETFYLINADGSEKPEAIWYREGLINPVVSPDGTKIAFVDLQGRLYFFDLISKQEIQIGDTSLSATSPVWSPDGKQIAFTIKNKDYTKNGLGIINIDGSGFFQLTPDNGGVNANWSPDGKQIVFARSNQIYTININNSNVKQLTQTGTNNIPTWSPDGSQIAFVVGGTEKCYESSIVTDSSGFCPNELWVMNADGSNKKMLRYHEKERIIGLTWIPSVKQ